MGRVPTGMPGLGRLTLHWGSITARGTNDAESGFLIEGDSHGQLSRYVTGSLQ